MCDPSSVLSALSPCSHFILVYFHSILFTFQRASTDDDDDNDDDDNVLIFKQRYCRVLLSPFCPLIPVLFASSVYYL